jgi:hypothetical protein
MLDGSSASKHRLKGPWDRPRVAPLMLSWTPLEEGSGDVLELGDAGLPWDGGGDGQPTAHPLSIRPVC